MVAQGVMDLVFQIFNPIEKQSYFLIQWLQKRQCPKGSLHKFEEKQTDKLFLGFSKIFFDYTNDFISTHNLVQILPHKRMANGA